MNTATRSCKVTVEILRGKDVLVRGHEVARHLWNYIRYCVKLHGAQHYPRSRKLGKRKNKKGEWVDNWQRPVRKNLCQGRLPWPGKYGLDKAFRGIWPGNALNDRCYSGVIRGYAGAYEAFMSKVSGGRKARPPHYCENPRPLFFDSRNTKHLGSWQFRLTVLGGRGPHRHAVVKLHVRPGLKVRDIRTLTVHPDGVGVVTYQVALAKSAGDHAGALDLGIVNLGGLVFDNGVSVLYSGKALRASNRWGHKQAAKCKPSNWIGRGDQKSKGSPRKRGYLVKAANSQMLALHNFTAHVIWECAKRDIGRLFVGQGLGHMAVRADRGKAFNQEIHGWPIGHIIEQLKYKGEEVGVEIIKISEAYTSQTCHACGSIAKSSRVHRGLYVCKDCGTISNADINGAINMLARGAGIDCSAFPGQPSYVGKFGGNWSIELKSIAWPKGLA